jgi:hypothetical protein
VPDLALPQQERLIVPRRACMRTTAGMTEPQLGCRVPAVEVKGKGVMRTYWFPWKDDLESIKTRLVADLMALEFADTQFQSQDSQTE